MIPMVFNYIILDRTAFGATLWTRFNIDIGHGSFLTVILQKSKLGNEMSL
jgi:hypothetical protein